MADPATLKPLLRRVVSPNDSISKSALREVLAEPRTTLLTIPSSFTSHLLNRAFNASDAAHVALLRRLLLVLLPSASASAVRQRLTSVTTSLRGAPISPRQGLIAVRVFAVLLSPPSETENAKEADPSQYRDTALHGLLAALAALSRVAVPAHGPQPRAKRKASRVAHRVAVNALTAQVLPQVVKTLQTVVDAHAKRPEEAVAAAALLAAHAASLTAPSLCDQLAVSVATAALKTPRTAPQLAVRSRTAALSFSAVSPDVLRNHLMPLVDRALVREPETALAASAALLSAFPKTATTSSATPEAFDLSAAAAKSIIPAILSGVKASNGTARLGAVDLARAVSPLLCDADVARDAVLKLVAANKAARYPYQRVAVWRAITSIVTLTPCTSLSLCDTALEGLHVWLASKKESNEEAHLAAYEALFDVLAHTKVTEKDVNPSSHVLQKCAVFVAGALGGKPSEADQRIVAQLLASREQSKPVGELILGAATRENIEKLLSPATTKAKQELSLLALTVLCEWACVSSKSPEKEVPEQLSANILKFLKDRKSCPAFWEPSKLESAELALCSLRCCVVLAQTSAVDLWEPAVTTMLKLCVDFRPAVAAASRRALESLRTGWSAETTAKVFMLLWNEHFSGENGHASVARTYDFDDSMIGAEKLGRALLTIVLPEVPEQHIPLVVIAANHPRLTSGYNRGRPAKYSRYWRSILPKLPDVDSTFSADEVDDWLEDSFTAIFGELGLRSEDSVAARAASNALVALSNEENKFVTRVLRRTVQLLHPLALASAQLGTEAFQAIRLVKEADALKEKESNDRSSATKKTKKPTSSSDARVNQARQAQVDKARAAAASASVMAEKVEAAKNLAKSAQTALSHSSRALQVILRICEVARASVYSLTASMLSLTLPLAKVEALESLCRDTVGAVASTTSKKLRPLSMELATCLYGLERGYDVKERVTSVVFILKDMVPPALSAEDFSLIAPVLQSALAREPDLGRNGSMAGRRGSSKRRDLVATTKAAAGVLLEHCKPDAIDAAVAAASCRAGSWVVRVLEREDGAFATAADVLAHLTGTVISPATDSISQVLQGVLSGKSSVRDAALAALARIPPLSSQTISCPRDATLGRTLWLARFDPDESNSELAEELWSNYKHPLHPSDDVPVLLGLVGHKEEDIRVMSSKSVAIALRAKEYESTRTACLSNIFSMYVKNLPGVKPSEQPTKAGLKRGIPPPMKRGKDRSKTEEVAIPDDGWFVRDGVARTLENMASVGALSPKDITVAFSFLAGRGLGDSNNDVRAKMAKAATAVVQAAGSLGPAVLLPMIEKQLNMQCPPSSTKEEIMHADRTRENLVTCLGSVANFLPADDPRVASIANQVIKSAMETPSEVVQNAAARCLAPLAKTAFGGKDEAELTKSLLGTVWSEKASYGQRRGAAYAMAGICAGLGLKFLHREKIITQIEAAVGEKTPLRRQGGFLLIETCAILMRGRFEPYVVIIVPFLLSCMSDGVVEVRNACWAAAQAAMSELTSQGVKLVLPSLVEGLKDRQWRTKAGSAEVLGAMAFCAPRQLAQCLPQVVPKLAEALADAHPKVIDAAESAINRIAAVVRSPEVRKLSPFLLAALRDPAGRTRGAVDAMLGSEFVHAIDAASLALLIPPLHRGLRDRSSELKKRSAAIVGSMCNNVANHFDVVPYLGLLLPALRITLLDAIPDVRRTSARALGALAVSLGEKGLPDIVPWLVTAVLGGARSGMETHSSERPKIAAASISSSAERSGAAMGLAEVAASMSERRLEEVLDRILIAGRNSGEAREGGLMLIAFLPRALGERFEGRIGTSLSAILQGLSDDSDNVREAALEAGRNLVSAYAKTSLEILLPELLSAMRDTLWRIRQAATRLLGDMLLVIAGAMPDRPDLFGGQNSAGNDEIESDESDEDGEEDKDGEDEEDEDEENFKSPEEAAAAMTTEAAMKVIEEILGYDRRNEVLAALYIVRCDVSVPVRQTAMQVWKSVVSNTPRVLREIMPTAVRQIVEGLGDEDEERRVASGKTLGDLAQKLGDRVVPEVLPALRNGIITKTNSNRIRKGACEGLGELVQACPKHQLEEHASDLIDTIYEGLSDTLESVRAIAADVFSLLLKPLGTSAVDAVVPRLLEKLSNENTQEQTETALDGLKQILRSSGTRLTSIIVPRLLKERPLGVAASRVISTAAIVSEGQFEAYVSDVTDCIVDSMESLPAETSTEHLESVLAAVAGCGDVCLKQMMDELIYKFNEGYPDRRIATSRVCGAYCRAAHADHVAAAAVTLLDTLVRQLADTDEEAAVSSWRALVDLSNALPSAELAEHIPIMRQALRASSTGVVAEEEVVVQGLQVPKSPAPFVPILTEALLQGAPELKEQAALCVSELVELVNLKSLGPFVIKLTGPLIRSLSGRIPWQVKAAVIRALHLLVKKGSALLRSFVPQLQSSFVKSLSDGNKMVRMRACAALSAIVPLQPRLEPLLNDLSSLGQTGMSPGARSAAFRACCQVFRLGKKLPDSSFSKIVDSILEGLADEDDEVWKSAGKALGHLSGRAVDRDAYKGLLEKVHKRLESDDLESSERVSIIHAIGCVYYAASDRDDIEVDDVETSGEDMFNHMESSFVEIRCGACSTLGQLTILLSKMGERDLRARVLMQLGEKAEFDDKPEVRIAALCAIKEVVRDTFDTMLTVAQAVVVCAGDTNTGVRDVAERVLRRAFIGGKEPTVNEDRVRQAKDMLDDDDARFLERKVNKVRSLPESGDERD